MSYSRALVAVLFLSLLTACGDDGGDSTGGASTPSDCTVNLAEVGGEGARVQAEGARAVDEQVFDITQYNRSNDNRDTTLAPDFDEKPEIQLGFWYDQTAESYNATDLSIEFADGVIFSFDQDEGVGMAKVTHREDADDEDVHITFCGTLVKEGADTSETLTIQGRICQAGFGRFDCN